MKGGVSAPAALTVAQDEQEELVAPAHSRPLAVAVVSPPPDTAVAARPERASAAPSSA